MNALGRLISSDMRISSHMWHSLCDTRCVSYASRSKGSSFLIRNVLGGLRIGRISLNRKASRKFRDAEIQRLWSRHCRTSAWWVSSTHRRYRKILASQFLAGAASDAFRSNWTLDSKLQTYKKHWQHVSNTLASLLKILKTWRYQLRSSSTWESRVDLLDQN